jgi:hypothetical protein
MLPRSFEKTRSSCYGGQSARHVFKALTTIGGEWNVALPSFRLWRTNLPSSIGTLADMDDTIIEINIAPVRTAQFAEPHACEDRRDYKRTTPCAGVIYQRI